MAQRLARLADRLVRLRPVERAQRLGGQPLGTGAKKLVVSGLQPYDAEVMESFVEIFSRRKAEYEAG